MSADRISFAPKKTDVTGIVDDQREHTEGDTVLYETLFGQDSSCARVDGLRGRGRAGTRHDLSVSWPRRATRATRQWVLPSNL